MKVDTTKQRLIDSGLFAEHGPHLVYEDSAGLLGGEVSLITKTMLRFNSAGELTSIVTRVSQEVPA